ncbi:MFS family permease [Bartonella japonica]|uniref:MFS family permease n=1 Tax=Bartonella japonica TaxID=357761 RepID=A0ABV2FPG1_9HYPH
MIIQKRDSYTQSEKYIVYTVIISSILPLTDGSIINVVLPDLAYYFSVEGNNIQWVVTSYFLATVPGLLMATFMQGRIGIKRTWLLASFIFMLGSLGVGLSYNFPTIISARIVQGIGTGLLLPLSQTIIALQFGQERVRQAMGHHSRTNGFCSCLWTAGKSLICSVCILAFVIFYQYSAYFIGTRPWCKIFKEQRNSKNKI